MFCAIDVIFFACYIDPYFGGTLTIQDRDLGNFTCNFLRRCFTQYKNYQDPMNVGLISTLVFHEISILYYS